MSCRVRDRSGRPVHKGRVQLEEDRNITFFLRSDPDDQNGLITAADFSARSVDSWLSRSSGFFDLDTELFKVNQDNLVMRLSSRDFGLIAPTRSPGRDCLDTAILKLFGRSLAVLDERQKSS